MRELPVVRMRELLHYDRATGVWTWTSKRYRRPAGSRAGHTASSGYVLIKVDGRLYLAHRMAVAYVTGEWPCGDVDHVNGARDDNRWSNLRVVTRTVNLQNQRWPRSSNRTGRLGVSVVPSGRFRAQIQVAGRKRYIGAFDTPEQAHEAYIAAKRKLHEGCTL